MPMSVPKKEPPKSTVSTQTAGIFYPSNKELLRKEEAQQESKAKQEAMSDRKLTLTAVSPGKGTSNRWHRYLGGFFFVGGCPIVQ